MTKKTDFDRECDRLTKMSIDQIRKAGGETADGWWKDVPALMDEVPLVLADLMNRKNEESIDSDVCEEVTGRITAWLTDEVMDKGAGRWGDECIQQDKKIIAIGIKRGLLQLGLGCWHGTRQTGRRGMVERAIQNALGDYEEELMQRAKRNEITKEDILAILNEIHRAMRDGAVGGLRIEGVTVYPDRKKIIADGVERGLALLFSEYESAMGEGFGENWDESLHYSQVEREYEKDLSDRCVHGEITNEEKVAILKEIEQHVETGALERMTSVRRSRPGLEDRQ